MRFRYLITAVFLLPSTQSLAAQTTEERLTLLEQQVAELRRIHGLPPPLVTELPVELLGNEHVRWGYPGGTCAFLIKEHYVSCHDASKRVPEWVTYHLTRQNLQGDVARTDDFRADPELTPGERAELEDYRNSGYDRGHMAPAAAFKRSSTAMSETFLLSNMVPQRPNLNRRIWRELESDVRSLARAHGSVWVFTGPLFLDADSNRTDPTTFIGSDSVAVPTHFYKVILCEHATGNIEMFAFMMPNQLEPIAGDPIDFAVTVDYIEERAALNFFTALSVEDQERLESMVATNWPIQ